MTGGPAVGVGSDDVQDFLERQLKALEVYKAKAPEKVADTGRGPTGRTLDFGDEKSVSEHIGPVQFNMGGIQVDADDMLQRIKVSLPTVFIDGREKRRKLIVIQDRNAHSSPDPAEEPEATGTNMAKDMDNEQLQNFFSGLMNRKTGGASDSPR